MITLGCVVRVPLFKETPISNTIKIIQKKNIHSTYYDIMSYYFTSSYHTNFFKYQSLSLKKYLFLPLIIQLGVRPFSPFRTPQTRTHPTSMEHVKPRNDPVTSNWNISSTVSQRARFSNGTSTTRGIASMA